MDDIQTAKEHIEGIQQYFYNILEDKRTKAIEKWDDIDVAIREFQYLYYGADSIARITSTITNSQIKTEFFEASLDFLHSEKCLKPEWLYVFFEGLASHKERMNIIKQLMWSIVWESYCGLQRVKRLKLKPIREKTSDYFSNHDYKGWQEFSEEAIQMLGKAKKSKSGKAWREIVRMEKEIDKRETKKTLNKGIKYWDDPFSFETDLLDSFNEVVSEQKLFKKALINHMESVGELSSFFFPTLASRYLPEPNPGWDNYLKKRMMIDIQWFSSINLALLQAEEMPSKIVKKVNEKRKSELAPHIRESEKDEDGSGSDFQKGINLEAPSNIMWSTETPEETVLKASKNVPHAEVELVKVISGEDCPTTATEIRETLKELPVKMRERFERRLTISYVDDKFIKLTDRELAKRLGCSERTLRSDDAELKRIYNKKLDDSPMPNPTSSGIKTPLDRAETDRSLICPKCGTIFPAGSIKTKICPICPGVKHLERVHKRKPSVT